MQVLDDFIFSLDEPNLTRILTVFKENLVKYKGKRTSQDVVLIVSSSLKELGSYGNSWFLNSLIKPFKKKTVYSTHLNIECNYSANGYE